MRTRLIQAFAATALLAASAFLYSCEKDFQQTEPVASVPVTTAGLSVNMNLPGRTLAANCFQCHGTNGYAGELKIATMSISEITNKMNQYASAPANGDIMNVHAMAYTPSEINLIADYFSKQ